MASAGDTAVEGGDAGFSVSIFARRLNAFADSPLVGGVPVLEDAPESSPARAKAPLAPSLARPLLLRLANMELGPKVAFCELVLVADPLSRLRSFISIVFWLGAGWP